MFRPATTEIPGQILRRLFKAIIVPFTLTFQNRSLCEKLLLIKQWVNKKQCQTFAENTANADEEGY